MHKDLIMKKYILFTILLIAFTTAIFAQKKSDDDFKTFWKTFKMALLKNDKIAILKAIKYPFNYHYATIEDEQSFVEKYYDRIFSKTRVESLIKSNTITITNTVNKNSIYYYKYNNPLTYDIVDYKGGFRCVFQKLNGHWKMNAAL